MAKKSGSKSKVVKKRRVFDVKTVGLTEEEIDKILAERPSIKIRVVDLQYAVTWTPADLKKYLKDNPDDGTKIVPLNAPFKLRPSPVTP